MARYTHDDSDSFEGKDRKRNKFSAKELRRAARVVKAKGQTEWQNESDE